MAQNLTHDERIYTSSIETSHPNSTPPQIFLHLKKLHTSCFDSYLQIYDGVPPNPRSATVIAQSAFTLLATLCGPDVLQENRFFRAKTGIFTIVYEGKFNFVGFHTSLYHRHHDLHKNTYAKS